MVQLTRQRRRLTDNQKRLLDLVNSVENKVDNKFMAEYYKYAVHKYIYERESVFLDFMGSLEQFPVSIEEFLESEEFVGSIDLTLWPVPKQALIDINKYWWKGPECAYSQGLFMGAASTGKTEICILTHAYHLHILGCIARPQLLYGLSPSTKIVFSIHAAKPHVTKKVFYQPLRSYIETMPWFRDNLRPEKHIESEIVFKEKNILVTPSGADSDAVLGEAIIASMMDEVNFMKVVQQSRRAEVQIGSRPGVYDQARSIYSQLIQRKKGRFIYRGPSIGLITVASQARYSDDFTEQRETEIKENKEKWVYVYHKAQFDAWPEERYCGKKFKLFVPNESSAQVRVLKEGEVIDRDIGTTYDVPIEYRDLAITHPADTLRNIIGRSLKSMNPFLGEQHKVMEAFFRGQNSGLVSILEEDNVHLANGMPRIKKDIYCNNPGKFRVVHIDLSHTRDRCGVAMLRFDGFAYIARETGESDLLPYCSVEMALSIQPSPGHPIIISEIRSWVQHLRKSYGFPIMAVSLDNWGSLETRQELTRQGLRTGLVSVDRTSVPYKLFRDAIYEDRINMYSQEILQDELLELEYDGQKDKIEHPPKGSKDVADAVCGAYFVLAKKAPEWGATVYGELSKDRFAAPRYSEGRV